LTTSFIKKTLRIEFEDEGVHSLTYYSVDKDGNMEDQKETQFTIDRTPPQIVYEASTDDKAYIPGTWTNKDVLVIFSCIDSLSGVSSFSEPALVSTEGENQAVEGECRDKSGNVSKVTATGINIDKTNPAISIFADPQTIWSPNGKLVPVRIGGEIQELNLSEKTFSIIDEYGFPVPQLNDFGSTIYLEAKRNDWDSDGRRYTINVEAVDLAGNRSSAATQVIVPHDQSKK